MAVSDWATAKIVAFHGAGKTFTFADANDIHAIPHRESLDGERFAFFNFRLFCAEFAQVAEHGCFNPIQVTQFAAANVLGFGFTKT